MSAAQKKKRNSDGLEFGKGMSRKRKKTDSTGRLGRITAIIAAVVAVLFICSLIINSNYFRQNFVAVTIDNVKYSITDFNYYYENVYILYYNSMYNTGGFGSSMLPSRDTPLKSQIYKRGNKA